ncbi:hypothetical protein JTE90_019174 [Oedothorax gibbosus]|uniref:Uncharacterized protein n=1 Tax=Oedothorax gibbosus TaxID=931172 RepID=A0AAV6USQ8_9ARAC|nr:hypothetical protein JTE90_019174 [Oedothorax gibbosus]
MWGSFKSILGQYYPKEEDVLHPKVSDETEGGWVLVDMEGNEMEPSKKQLRPPSNSPLRLSPLPLLDISNASSPQSSPQLSPTQIEEGWFVAPPPCFTKNSPPGAIEISPLEDLLIEHPSMSVYAQVPSLRYTREPKEGSTAVARETAAKRTKELRVEISPLATYPKPKASGAKSQLDLKHFVDQVENTKPSQQAKWESDQYKLCPSYMNRQNRVHRYQSRKHHNQKKKSLAKPFAEKNGKHGF